MGRTAVGMAVGVGEGVGTGVADGVGVVINANKKTDTSNMAKTAEIKIIFFMLSYCNNFKPKKRKTPEAI